MEVTFVLLALPLFGLAAIAYRVDRRARGVPAAQPAGAIVMLGARVQPDGQAAPALQYRARRAAELYASGRAPLIVFSGGSEPGLPSEARVAAELAIAAGAPSSACVLEEQSRSTSENAARSAPLLKQRGITEVLLVSDGYHLLRAQAHFARHGIVAHPVPSGRRLETGARLIQTAREALALARSPWLLF